MTEFQYFRLDQLGWQAFMHGGVLVCLILAKRRRLPAAFWGFVGFWLMVIAAFTIYTWDGAVEPVMHHVPGTERDIWIKDLRLITLLPGLIWGAVGANLFAAWLWSGALRER